MSAPIPRHLLKKVRVLAEVPRSSFCEAPACSDPGNASARRDFLKLLRKGTDRNNGETSASQGPQDIRLNAATWLRLPKPPAQPVALALLYKTREGEFAVIVEETRVPESGTVMLSGEVRIKTREPVESLRACCLGLDSQAPLHVDELFVQRAGDEEADLKQKSA